MKKNIEISVIIKVYNEERNIKKCVDSVLKAVRGFKHEIIVVDSNSTDNSIKKIIKKPIKIIQLKKGWLKTPAAALQAGYLHSNGKYIYVLDGDMTLNKDAIRTLKKYLDKDIKLAGIAGTMQEINSHNIMHVRIKRWCKATKIGYVNYLNGGGLYRVSSIKKVGYLSNPYLLAAEESELAYNLISKGFSLKRIKKCLIKHNFHTGNSFAIIWKKWKLGRMFGYGQVLRSSLNGGYFKQYLKEARLYVFILSWLFLGLLSLLFKRTIKFYLAITLLVLFFLFLKKKNLKDLILSCYSWFLSAIGLLIGFLIGPKNPYSYPRDYRVIK